MQKLIPLLALSLLLAACGGQPDDGSAPPPAPTATASTSAAADTSTTNVGTTEAAKPATVADAAASAEAPATPSSAGANAAPAADATAADGNNTPEQASQQAPKQGKIVPPPPPAAWVAGEHYFVLEPQQARLHAGDKVEVVEVFSYGCPACHRAEPFMRKLVQSLPAYAHMGYLPVSFRPDENFPLYQRAFYTAKVFGVARQAHDDMFKAIWVDHTLATYDAATGRPKPKDEWPGIKDVAQFYASYGVDPKAFVATAKSFGVDTKMRRADQMIQNWGVRSTPTIVINGKYRLTPASAGSYSKMIELALWLAQKARHDMQTAG